MTAGIVTFVYADWAAQYPELASSIAEPQALNYFNFACLYLDNSATSPILDATATGPRATILYMLTSHIATLLATVNGNAPSPLVGRISNASEGSVSVATDMPQNPGAAWFNQTKYGALAYQAMAPWRQALYIPAPQIPLAAQSFPFFRGGYGRGFF